MKLLFDIGGTTTRLGVSSDGDHIEQIATYPTPQVYQQGLEALRDNALQLSQGNSITSIAGGIAGGLNADRNQLLHGGNIPDWVGKPLVTDLQNIFPDATVIIDNDTAMAALGERHFGAGRGKTSLLYLAVGTGVGGAWIAEGKIANKPFSFEPGHQIIDYPNKLSLQDLVSGKAMSNLFGKSPADIPSEELWQEIAQPLATGLANSFRHWPSEIIVLGGGVILGHQFPIAELSEALMERLPAIQPFPPVTLAELGDYPALYGALYSLSI